MKRLSAWLLALALLFPAHAWAWTAGGGAGTYSPTLQGNITITGGDLFLDSGRKIDWGAGNVTETHSANTLTYAGLTTLKFPTSTVLDWGGANITLTHAAGTLTLAGGQLVFPVGTSALPSVAVGEATTGLYRSAAAQLDVTLGAARAITFSVNDTYHYGNRILMGAASDLYLTWEAANIFQQGPDAAVPDAQTFKGADGSGADKAGGDMTFACGRGTGTGLGGNCYIATAPAGASTGSSQNALVNRVAVSPKGVVGFSPQDVAATPVEPTTTLKVFAYNKSVADDGIVTLPAVTTNGYGKITVGTTAATYAQFVVGSTGTVTLLGVAVITTADVVANADTDAKLCIGTAGTQEPLQIKNRLGSTQVLNIEFWYD